MYEPFSLYRKSIIEVLLKHYSHQTHLQEFIHEETAISRVSGTDSDGEEKKGEYALPDFDNAP